LNAENCKLIHDLLMPAEQMTMAAPTCGPISFFGSLVFAFLETRKEVGQEVLAKIQAVLNAKRSPDVSFEEGGIIGTASKTFLSLAELKLSTEDAAKAVAENTI
jgi:hypothetical protein